MPHPHPVRSLARACAAALLLAAGLAFRGSGAADLPSILHVCETNTATLCAAWRLDDGVYVADWTQGSHAVIRAAAFGDRDVVLIRDDPSGTSAGMHAVYVGTATGSSVKDGVVVWSRNGEKIVGLWKAQW